MEIHDDALKALLARPRLRADARIVAATALLDRGQPKRAARTLQMLVDGSDAAVSGLILADAYYHLAIARMMLSQPERAVLAYSAAADAYRRGSSAQGELHSMVGLGSAQAFLGRFDDVFATVAPFLQRVESDFERYSTCDRGILAVGYVVLADAFKSRAEFDRAIAVLESGLISLHDAPARALRGAIHQMLGALYSRQGDYIEALQQFQEALAVLRGARAHRRAIAQINDNMAFVLVQQGEILPALESINRAIKLWSELESQDELNESKERLGTVQYLAGNYEAAALTFQEVAQFLLERIQAEGAEESDAEALERIREKIDDAWAAAAARQEVSDEA
eukprot:m.168909 g.168909  ORF g.168909 m.168909 type:complete len:338 (-) comp10359_c3_seq7:32-1045(-)